MSQNSASGKPLVLGFVGQNANNALLSSTQVFCKHVSKLDVDAIVLDLHAPDVLGMLGNLLKTRPVLFGFGFAGVGADLRTAQNKIIWDEMRVPFLSLMYDHPFYIPERHNLDSRYVANCYYSEDFYEVQTQYVRSKQPVFLFPQGEAETKKFIMPVPWKERKFLATFVKTGIDPRHVARTIDSLHEDIRAAVWESVPIIQKDLKAFTCDIVRDHFTARGAQVTDNMPQFMLTVRLIDEYVRAWRATQIVEFLKMMKGVLIVGDGWDHIENRGKYADFLPSIGQKEAAELQAHAKFNANTNPVNRDYMHERAALAIKIPACLITDSNRIYERHYADLASVCAFSWAEDWQEKIRGYMVKSIKSPPDFEKALERKNATFGIEPMLQAIINAVQKIRATNV